MFRLLSITPKKSSQRNYHQTCTAWGGIALCKAKTTSAVTSAVFRSKGLRRAVINRSCLELDKESRKIVNKKKCLLKRTSLDNLKKFTWSNLMKEWKREASILYKVLMVIATPSQVSQRKLQGGKYALAPKLCIKRW